MTITITIPVQIDRRVTPNGRAHWRVKNELMQELKDATYYATREVFDLETATRWLRARRPFVLDYEIAHGKGRKRLDDDNAIAAMKPIRDQIATCLGIDDRNFTTGTMTQIRDPQGAGYVRVTIQEAPDASKHCSKTRS